MREIFKLWFLDLHQFKKEEFYKSELGNIPEGWKVDKLGNLCDVKGGKRLPKGVGLIKENNNHPYIRVRDINKLQYILLNNEYEYVDSETQKSIEKYIVSTDDVVLSIVGTIGLVAKVHNSLDGANLTENCVKLTNMKEVTSNYIYLWLTSKNGQENINEVTVGAVQAKLPIKNIQNMNVLKPPVKIINEFEELIRPFSSEIQKNLYENENLSKLRDILLPKLMNGEIDLSNISLEE